MRGGRVGEGRVDRERVGMSTLTVETFLLVESWLSVVSSSSSRSSREGD